MIERDDTNRKFIVIRHEFCYDVPANARLRSRCFKHVFVAPSNYLQRSALPRAIAAFSDSLKLRHQHQHLTLPHLHPSRVIAF